MTTNINLTKACKLSAEIDAISDEIEHRSAINSAWWAEHSKHAQKRLDEAKEALDNDKGYQALQAAIDEVQKGCRVRTITAQDVIDNLHRIERELAIPKKALDGVQVFVDPNAQTFPSAYHGIPMSTEVCATYHNRGWRIEWIDRKQTQRHEAFVIHTHGSMRALLDRFSTLW